MPLEFLLQVQATSLWSVYGCLWFKAYFWIYHLLWKMLYCRERYHYSKALTDRIEWSNNLLYMSKKPRNEFEKLQHGKPREYNLQARWSNCCLMKKAWDLNWIFAALVKLDMGSPFHSRTIPWKRHLYPVWAEPWTKHIMSPTWNLACEENNRPN